MWISAANETILALNCLLFLILWRRGAARGSTICFVLAHVMFAVALFSKEAAVVMAPLAAIQLLLDGYSFRAVLRKSIALIAMLCAFLLLWHAVAQRNPFVTLGYYEFGSQFVFVYFRSLARILSQLVPFVAAWIITRYRYGRREASNSWKSGLKSHPGSWTKAGTFFGAFMLLAIVPYSFLTYLNHIPSRHTYLASIGLAGLIGIISAALYTRMTTVRTKRLWTLSFCALLIGNIGYIWLKKVPQYRERAAPTRELIEFLNARSIPQFPMHVCGFPLDPWVFSETVKRFTRFDSSQVILISTCGDDMGSAMRWDENTSHYRVNIGGSHAD